MTDQAYSIADLLRHAEKRQPMSGCPECTAEVRVSFLPNYPEVPIHEVVHERTCPAIPRQNRAARRQMRQRRAGKR